MNALTELKRLAKRLGWEYSHRDGKHELWISPRGHSMPLPSGKISSDRQYKNIQANIINGAKDR